MHIDDEALRARMARHSREELQAILAGGEQYTPEARAAARHELVTRTREPEDPPARDHVANSPIDRAIVRLSALRDWEFPFLPKNLPSRLRKLFWASVFSIASGVAAVIRLVFFPAAKEDGTAYLIFLAAAGALFVFAIIAKHVYSRWLAALMTVALAVYTMVVNWHSGLIDFGVPVAAIVMLLYLRRDPEAVNYYRELSNNEEGRA